MISLHQWDKKEEYTMKKNAKKLNALLLCVSELVIGILLLIKPVEFTAGIMIAMGIVLMARGALSILGYFRTPAQEAAQKQNLASGLGLAVTGAFCAFGYQWLMAAVPFLGIIYAVVLLWLGIQKVQTAVDQLRLGFRLWYIAGASALVSLAAAVIIFCNPFAAAAGLWIFAGVSLIVEAVADMAAFVLNLRKN